MDRSTPGLPVHHQLLEFTQTHVHRVRDGLYCKSLHSRALVRNDSLFPADGRKYYPVGEVEPWKVSSRETALEELELWSELLTIASAAPRAVSGSKTSVSVAE